MVLLLRRIAANFHKRFALRSAARDDAGYTKVLPTYSDQPTAISSSCNAARRENVEL
jgi:hypothetical protein